MAGIVGANSSGGDDAVRKVCSELGEVIFVLEHRDPNAPVPRWLIQRLGAYRSQLQGALSHAEQPLVE